MSTTENYNEVIRPLLYVTVGISGIALPTYISLLEQNQFIRNMTNVKKILHLKKTNVTKPCFKLFNISQNLTDCVMYQNNVLQN